MEDAQAHAARGAGTWAWASNDADEPDVVLGAAGDVPTIETMAAAWLLHRHAPQLRVRVANVIDLFALMRRDEHPHGLTDEAFEQIFGRELPVVFAFHGYPRVIHELIDHRPDPQRFHVRGYIEEGTTTTPFDMVVRNRMSRYHLALEALARTRRSIPGAVEAAQTFNERLTAHAAYIAEHGIDMPDVADWRWTDALAPV